MTSRLNKNRSHALGPKTLLFLLIALLLAPFQGAFAGTVTVATGTTYQTISGFGAASVWNSIATLRTIAVTLWHDDSGSPPASQVNGQVGLSINRILIDESGNSNWGTEAAAATLAISQNPNMRIFGSSWSPPAKWKNNNNVSGNNTGNTNFNPGTNTNQLNASNYAAYAAYQTSWATAMKNTYGFTPYALSVQNEPDYDVTYQSCLWTPQAFDTYIGTHLGPALTAAGFASPIIMMPESFADNLTGSNTTMANANSAKYVKVVGNHLYGGGPNTIPASYSTVAGHTVESWETEISDFAANDNSITSGLKYANQIHNCVADHNFNAYVYWWILNLNTDNEGLYGPSQSTTPTKRLFALGNFSKFIRPGFVRVGATEVPSAGVSVSSYYSSSLGKVVIVAINNNGSAQSTTFNFTGFTASTAYPWITDSSRNLVQQTSVAVSAGSFTYSLPAQSICTFVCVGAAGPTPTFTVSPTRTNTPIPGAFCQVDDLEDMNTTNLWGGGWGTYQGTASAITLTMAAGGSTGSTAGSASITGTIGANDYGGVYTNLVNSGVTNVSNYIGVAFMAKGNGSTYWFQVPNNAVTTGDHYGVSFVAPAAWTPVTLLFNAAVQRGFGAGQPFDLTQVTALQWGGLSGTVNLQIDDVRLLGAYCPGGTPTFTRTPTRTNTAVPPTSTSTRTNTAVPPTSTSTSTYTTTRTNTPVPPTSTNTPVPATSTSTLTRTVVPPTQTLTATSTLTRTNTAVPPTSTNTAVPPTSTLTRTSTAVPPTSTNTSVPPTPTSTLTRTNTAVPPTSTNTPVPPTFTSTLTRTNTAVPPTSTNTPVPATSTSTRTNTMVPPTSTSTLTRTNTSVPPTSTNTPVPATSTSTLTRTNTAIPPTSTNTPVPATSTSTLTRTNTAVPPTATNTSLPPTATLTRTNTAVPPTSTSTLTRTSIPVPPTLTSTPTLTISPTSTNTGQPTGTSTSTSTRTNTSVPPTLTSTSTSTPVPPTATATLTRTNTPVPPTLTSTLTRTSTPVPPTSTSTSTTTNTPVPPTLTSTTTRTNTQVPPTLTATPTLTISPTATDTGAPTATRTATSSVTATASSTDTAVPTQTSTATSTATLTISPTATDTGAPTATRTATPSSTSTLVNTPTSTTTSTASRTATPSATSSPTLTLSPTATFTLSSTPSRTATGTTTSTSTLTSVNTTTATSTLTQSPTSTSTASPSSTRTATPSSTATLTASNTPTLVPTSTSTPIFTATATNTQTLSPTVTQSPTCTVVPTTNPIIFPNPVSTGSVVILPQAYTGLYPVTVQIYTTGFKLVLEKVFPPQFSGTTVKVDLLDNWGQALADGIYHVYVTVNQDRKATNLVIAH